MLNLGRSGSWFAAPVNLKTCLSHLYFKLFGHMMHILIDFTMTVIFQTKVKLSNLKVLILKTHIVTVNTYLILIITKFSGKHFLIWLLLNISSLLQEKSAKHFASSHIQGI